tara:strand:- start:57 stop:512 length:456 start_codon:yes stop_codon:yes gene_type:complete
MNGLEVCHAGEERMAGRARKKDGAFKRWWQGKRDKHLQILSAIFLGSIAMILSSLVQLVLLRQDAAWADYTTLAWTLLALSSLIAIWVGPEFVHYIGQYNLLNEVLELDSHSEVSRRRQEAEAAAKILGSQHIAKLDEHLVELGLKRAKRT